jgi:two-component system, OmpR family, sensor histidine kinase KdpD
VEILKIDWSGRYWGYLIAIGMVVVVTVAGYLFQAFSFYDPNNTDMLYILCVAISAIYLGFGPSITASILSVLAFDFFYIPPLLKFTVATEQGIVNLLILAIVTVVISCLSPRIRQ